MTLRILFIAFTTLLSFLNTIAQDFEVAPVTVNFKVEAGNTKVRTLYITNHDDKTQIFNLTLTDYEVDENGNSLKKKEGNPKRSLKKALTISPSFIELPPNGSGQVDLILKIPSGDSNTKWGMVSVEAVNERTINVDQSLATGIKISPRIAVYIQQSPRSNNQYSAKVLSFVETTKEGDIKRTFETAVENFGGKIMTASLKLLLANIDSGEETELMNTTANLHPEQKKTISFSIDRPKPGKYALAVILDYGHNASIEGSQIVIEEK